MQVLNPQSMNWTLIWNMVSVDVSTSRISRWDAPGIGAAPKSTYKKKEKEIWDTDTQRRPCTDRSRVVTNQRTLGERLEARRGETGFSSRAQGGSAASPTPWFCRLQNGERMHCCCFMSPSLRSLPNILIFHRRYFIKENIFLSNEIHALQLGIARNQSTSKRGTYTCADTLIAFPTGVLHHQNMEHDFSGHFLTSSKVNM